jgi:hypothetical protein
MRNRIRIFIVPPIFVFAFAALYAVTIGLTHVLIWRIASMFGRGDPTIQQLAIELSRWSLPVLAVWGALYGAYRSYAFHPVRNVSYWKWLANTPWRPSMALPLGPVHFVWQDALQMGILAILSARVSHSHPAIPLICMLLGYLAVSAVNLGSTRQFGSLAVILVVFPISWDLSASPWLMLMVLVVVYLVAIHGISRSWRLFPWNLQERLATPKRWTVPAPTIGWPFDRLNAHDPYKQFDRRSIFFGSLLSGGLAGWYVFSFLYCVDHSEKLNADSTVFAIIGYGCGAALFRVLVYCRFCFPPVTLLGRIVSGRLILPGYDRVFVGPLLMAFTAIAGSMALRLAGVYPPLMAGIMTTVLLAMLIGLPPTMRNWQLTGQHRMVFTSRPRTLAR